MNDRTYYRAALECALLDGTALEERINERIARLPKRREVRVRMPKRLIIALVAGTLLLVNSRRAHPPEKLYVNAQKEKEVSEKEEHTND